ncbi:hypothetical protein IC582_024246 [Cucumis melo]
MPLVGMDWTQSGVAKLFSAIKDGEDLPDARSSFLQMDYFLRCIVKIKYFSLLQAEIRRLFPSDHNPFYTGFGNQDTDELSYLKMGIPKGKIFIINPKGEVMNTHSNNPKSYKSLLTLVNDFFPPASSVEQEDFNEWNYWKMPLPEVAVR